MSEVGNLLFSYGLLTKSSLAFLPFDGCRLSFWSLKELTFFFCFFSSIGVPKVLLLALCIFLSYIRFFLAMSLSF